LKDTFQATVTINESIATTEVSRRAGRLRCGRLEKEKRRQEKKNSNKTEIRTHKASRRKREKDVQIEIN
jgi:hypothetical protein